MNDKGEIIIYQTPDGATSIDVKLEKDTVWLNRQQMAELFGCDVKTIGKHIGNALKEDLEGMSTVAKFAIVDKFPALAVAKFATAKTAKVESYTELVRFSHKLSERQIPLSLCRK